jgi:hypothetical protein
MTQESDALDGHIDQAVKARWLAIGLSQTDLAEVLGLAQVQKGDNGSNGAGAGHLTQVAEALELSAGSRRPNGGARPGLHYSPAEPGNSLQALLALRLLRAFHELNDQSMREVVVQLAEQMVKRQVSRR